MSPRTLRFGAFSLDLDDEGLRGEHGPIELRPKALAVLRYLAERPGRLLRKEELLAGVWAGIFVSPGVLKVCIHEIRRALAETPTTPRFVETVGRRGYRFVAPVQGVSPPSDADALLGRNLVLVPRDAADAVLDAVVTRVLASGALEVSIGAAA